jgi:hypothetical protein
LGPTLAKEEALGIVPEAIIRPPAKQSDIISDIVQLNPTHLILIDGEFSQNLSVGIKEIIYALLFPALEERVYGASSMGALRAADTAHWGMIGHGKIFDWSTMSILQSGLKKSLY